MRIASFIAIWCGTLAVAAAGVVPRTTRLSDDWAIFATNRVDASGEVVSTVGFDTADWYSAKVPSTVMGALTGLRIYRDPLADRNLASISSLPFEAPWWYRTEFKVDSIDKNTVSRLVFDGINYKADVFLNGKLIAARDKVYGAWRVHDLDVSQVIRQGANALAVRVYRPQNGEFTLGWVNWNPAPPDTNMGIYREVFLRQSHAVSIEAPYVQSKLDLKTLKEASLTVQMDLVNHSSQPETGTLKAELGEVHFEIPYSLKGNEVQHLKWTPEQVAALRIRNPRLWWPVNLGSPELYTLKLSATNGNQINDTQSVTFGIREVGDYLNEQGHRGYTINGRRILLRAGGWTDEIFLRETDKNLEIQTAYIKDMNLNAIRLEGFWGSSQKLYEWADRRGLLVLVGFSCEWEWPEYLRGMQYYEDSKPLYGGPMHPKAIELAASYLHDQVRWLRNHPSVLAWVIGSDKMPIPEAEKRYREVLSKEDPTRPILISAQSVKSTVSGPSGVKMFGPYEYVTPNYWFEDRKNGGAYGFNTETGPGAQIPVLSSLKKIFNKKHLWPVNEEWDYHSGFGEFADLDYFCSAYNQRYGVPKTVDEFAFKVQASNYEAVRAMFEAFGANQPEATGVVQWMINSAWPNMIRHAYDYFLVPTGAYYGIKKGCQPLNVLWDAAHNTIHVVNDTRDDVAGANVRIKLFRFDSTLSLDRELKVDMPNGGTHKVFDLPARDPQSPVSFLDLRLVSSSGQELARNFYWISSKPDVLDPESTQWFVTRNKAYADFSALDRLPSVDVKAEPRFSQDGCTVTLVNRSNHLAFCLELQVQDAEGNPVIPVLWEDNYVSLLPGEERTVRAQYLKPLPSEVRPKFEVHGWNLKP